jgi:hypothetical protein
MTKAGSRTTTFTLLGLLAVAIFAIGWLIGRDGPAARVWDWPPPIYAATSESTDDLAIAIGLVAEDVEGLFALDGLSGDLQCTVFNPTAQVFNTVFRRNVLADLELDVAKSPRFVLATGELQALRRGTRQIGSSLAYVIDASSGKFAVYAIPWQRAMFTSGRPQQGELMLIQAGSIRTAAVRE